MPKTTTDEPKVDLVKARQEGIALIGPLESAAARTTVENEDDYENADALLTRIAKTEKQWLERIDPPINHIRQGLDMLYGLKNDVAKPLAALKVRIKGMMKDYKIEEQRRIQIAETARIAEIRRLEAEASAKNTAGANAKSQLYKNKLQQQQLEAAGHLRGIKVSGSLTRTTKKWRITDLSALMAHVLEGDNIDLMALVQVCEVQMNAYFKLQAPGAGKPWLPGVEVYEDIDIVKSRA